MNEEELRKALDRLRVTIGEITQTHDPVEYVPYADAYNLLKKVVDEIQQKIKEARINELKTIKSLVDHNILHINNEGKFIGG